MANDILMIEDDRDLCEIVTMYLYDNGMQVRAVYQGRMMEEELSKKIPDLIILDIELPDRDGFELCQKIRKIDENVPIIFLTNHIQESNRIQAFEMGGDDFVSKPFSLEELRLRIMTRLKDKQRFKQQTSLTFGTVTLDLQSEELMIGLHSIQLTSIETEIFRLLASHPDKIYSEKDIYSMIWKENYNRDTRMVNVHISNIRRKLEKIDPNHKYIQTIWGKGYKYVA